MNRKATVAAFTGTDNETTKGASQALLCLALVFPAALALGQTPQDMSWPDIEAAHGLDLSERGWDKRYVLDTFDHNHDGALDQEEQRMLVVSLDIREPQMAATGMNTRSQASTAMTAPQQTSGADTPAIQDV